MSQNFAPRAWSFVQQKSDGDHLRERQIASMEESWRLSIVGLGNRRKTVWKCSMYSKEFNIAAERQKDLEIDIEMNPDITCTHTHTYR